MRKLNTLICFIIFGLGSVVISATLLPILWLFCWNGDRRKLLIIRCVRLSWRFFRRIMELLRLIKIRVSSEDRQTLSSITSTVIAATHHTLIDIVILVTLVKDATCIVKGKLFQNFFVRFVVANAFISNDEDPEVLINSSVAALRKGYNLIIFPEGTRSSESGKLQRGTAHIAAESHADILVLTIDVNPLILRKGKDWRDAGEKPAVYDIRVKTVLKPMEIIDAGKSRNINARMLTARIKEAFE